jgi:hypothetical protein
MVIHTAFEINKVDKTMAEILGLGPFIDGKARQFLRYELCNNPSNHENHQIGKCQLFLCTRLGH